jgi:hypothetical protein
VFLSENETRINLKNGEHRATVRMELLQSSRRPGITGLDKQAGRTNYLFPDDPARSLTDIPNYARVRYSAVYPGIDWLYYGDRQQLEYDFILAPGADPKQIAVKFRDARDAAIDSNGDLVISTEAGELRQEKPRAYQDIDGKRKIVEVQYVKRGRDVFAFRIGAYDRSKPLVIDPVLTFSTYIGGSLDETGNGIAVDANGFVYVAGSTDSYDFPAPHHIAFCRPFGDTEQDPCINPAVIKLDPDGAGFVYATYFVVGDGSAHAIAIDAAGNAYLTGNTDTGVDLFNLSHAFIAKLNSTGSQLLYYKTVNVPVTISKPPFLSSGEAIAVDNAGNAYATGSFVSNVFVIKLDPGGNTVWSKLMQTSNFGSGTGLALDPAGSVYVAGHTGSDFPTTPGAFQTSCSPTLVCGFVAKIDALGSSVLYSTFLEGAAINGLTVNSAGNAYVTGSTTSPNLPIVNAIQPSLAGCPVNPCQDAFVTEFNSSGSGLIFSTYLGGTGTDAGQAITLDPSGNIYIAGSTSSTDFPVLNAVQATLGSGAFSNDGFVTKINASGSALLYSTYLGGGGADEVNAIAADAYGNVYAAGTTFSRNFPTMRALQPLIGGAGFGSVAAGSFNSDAFVSKISSSNNSDGGARLIQANAVEGAGTGSLSAAFPSNNTAGNLIIAFVRMSTTSQTVTITDSANNPYIDAVSQAQDADGHQIHIFYSAGIRGGANTVRAAFSSTNNHPWLAIYEYSGLLAVNPLDQVAHAQGNDAAPFTGLINTTRPDELEFAAAGFPASYGGTVAAGSGSTLLAQDTGRSRAATEAAALNAAGQSAGRLNLSPATNWTAAIATFIVAPAVIPPPSITTAALRNAVQNSAYGDVVTVTNGKLPYGFSIISGNLPAGIVLNPLSGTISGTATITGTANFTVQVIDANSQMISKALSITVNPNAAAPVITTTSLPAGMQGQPYSGALAASGGLPPYTWSLLIQPDLGGNYGEFPAGLKLDPKSGIISGTPTDSGSMFLVQVTDADYHSAISGPLTISIGATGGVALVQSTAASGTGVSNVIAAFPSATTGGNTIIAFVRMSSTNQTVTVGDGSGNTYTEAVSAVQTADGHQIHVFYATNIKGGPDSVIASFSSTNNHPWLAIYEYTGAMHLDRTAAAQGAGTAVSSGSTAVTTSATELVFAGLGLPASSTASIASGAGFTLLQQNPSGSPGANESNPVSVMGSFTGTFTLSTSETWTAVVATFAVGNAPPPPPPAGIARVQGNSAEATAQSSISVSFLSATTAGDMIIAFVRMSTTSQTVKVTDSAGNTYIDAVSQSQTADGSQVHIFYASKINGGPDSLTATFSGINNHPFMAVYEYSGITALDSIAHAQGVSAGPASGNTAPASSPNELVFGGLDLPSSLGVSVAAGPGFTMEFQDVNQFGSRAATEDAITNLPGPFNATFSLSGSGAWASIVASFKP